MTGVARAVFRALHEGKWLSIEYRNGFDKVTRFWAGIRGLNAKTAPSSWMGCTCTITR